MKKRKTIFCAVFTLFLFLAFGLFLIAQTDEAKDDERPKRDWQLRPLAQGLQWSSGLNPATIQPPRVQKIAVPPIRTQGIKTFGIAYDIQMDAGIAEYPLHIVFPLPKEALTDPEKILFLKISGEGEETLLFPSAVDEENARATLLIRSFSKIVPCSWDTPFHQAIIEGTMTMKEEAEEDPGRIYFDMTCKQTHSGEYANFVQETDGLGPFKFFMPLPAGHFGSYVFQRIIGFTSNFIFIGDPRITPPLNIDGRSSTYNVTLNVIPATTRMEGRVVDGNGNPLEGVRIAVAGPYNVTFRTRSREGGRYFIDYIGMTDTRKAMTESMVCTLTNPEDKECDPITLTLNLTAGQTYREDLVYHPQGEIRGYIRDKWGNELDRAFIEVKPSRGEIITQEVGSPYRIEHIPVGEATVTVTCPSEVHQQTRTIDIACNIPGFSVEFTNFELECSGEIHGSIRDKWGNEMERATLEIKPSQGETIIREVGSPYRIDDIPVGEATVTAICPANIHRQTKTVSITCEPPGSKKDETDFELECSGEIRGFIRDKDGTNLERVTLEIRPSLGNTIIREVGSPYHVEDIPIGEATVTAVCPEGPGRQSKKVQIRCEGPDSAKADTHFVLDCATGMVFRIHNAGDFTSMGHLYNITASTSKDFTLPLPKGESEAEVDVTYTVEHKLEANAVGPPHIISINPSSYALNAVIRWRVEKHEKSNGVDEYIFSGEIVHHETREIKTVYDSGSGLDPILNFDFAGVPALIDQLVWSLSYSVRKGEGVDEFPFAKTEELSHTMPQGIIGSQGQAENRSRSTIRIEISGRTND